MHVKCDFVMLLNSRDSKHIQKKKKSKKPDETRSMCFVEIRNCKSKNVNELFINYVLRDAKYRTADSDSRHDRTHQQIIRIGI